MSLELKNPYKENYAKSPREKQVVTDIQDKKLLLTSVISAYLKYTKQIISPYVFENYTNSKGFYGWIKKCLLPVLKKGQIVVMDNAPFPLHL